MKKKMKKVGYGVFTWPREERVYNRYGAFHLDREAYEGEGACAPRLDLPALNCFKGKRVRLTVEVVESRRSGHVGDLFLKIFPTQPSVGERIVLGVGRLDVLLLDGVMCVALAPEDGRRELWIDPRLLYRAHDQTVNLYVEETKDPPHAAPVIAQAEADGTVGADDAGGIQCKRERVEDVRLAPEFERLGGGMFVMHSPEIKPGKRIRTAKK